MSHSRDLTAHPIPGTLFRLAWPMFFGMLAIMVFNLVDTLFVARLGTRELAAMSFTFPVVFFLGGLTLGLGAGLTAVLSGEIGAGRLDRVRAMTRDALLLALSLVAVFSIAGHASIDPLFRLLGADAEALPLVRQYMGIWYSGFIFVVVPMVGNGAIRATGDTRTPALIMAVSGLANILLDPLLIFGWGPFPAMELRGAALATVIARALSLVFALWILVHREKLLPRSWPRPGEMLGNWKSILFVGAPAALSNVLMPLSLGLLTRMVAGYGTAAVAAFGAGGRVQGFAMMVPMAWGSALMPFMGQNWGAQRSDRVAEALRYSARVLVAGGVIAYLVLVLAAPLLADFFSREGDVHDPLTLFMRLGLMGFPAASLVMIANSTFNAHRQPMRAMGLNLLRLFGVLLPLAWLGSRLLGLNGIFLAMSLTEFVVGAVAWIWLAPLRREAA